MCGTLWTLCDSLWFTIYYVDYCNRDGHCVAVCGLALTMWTTADVMDTMLQFMDTVWQFVV